jgi:hypothetical protein
VWPGNLAPDHADLGSADLLLTAIDVGDLLAKVEVGGIDIVYSLNLDQAGAGVSGVTRALVAQVTSLDVKSVASFGRHGDCDLASALSRTRERRKKLLEESS